MALCTRLDESKAYLTACLKVLLALPLAAQDPGAIKQLRAFVGKVSLVHVEMYDTHPLHSNMEVKNAQMLYSTMQIQ